MNASPLRNVAIIAHVDHGKTTLVDQMLQQSGQFRDNQVMVERVLDSNALERERGITILSKNISIRYKGVKINLIDTPGHADFGGEVERVLKMATGVLLLVDAFEGPMPQTRFVLRKALETGLKPIVVINKIDRPDARPHEVLDEVFELFLELNANDDQLDFPVVYASGREGFAKVEVDDQSEDLEPLFQTILDKIPAPADDPSQPLQMLITTLDYNDYVGRIGIGRIFAGEIYVSERVMLLKRDGKREAATIAGLFSFEGLGREAQKSMRAGDICAIQGIQAIDIGDTIADFEQPKPLPIVNVDEPTISMIFSINSSPFAGREGKYVTSRQLRDRLHRELRSNVALRVTDLDESDSFLVAGRGVLHLGILIENMRREGYEFAVSRPHVIFKEIDGKKAEPVEWVVCEVPESASGKVIEMLGGRRGELVSMNNKNGLVHLEYRMPTRGLIGIRSRLLSATSGEAILHHNFYQYEFFKGPMPQRTNGTLVSHTSGQVTAYALEGLRDRGTMYVRPGDEVYEGQVVGENCKSDDIVVNVCRLKKLTNVRAVSADKNVPLPAPRDIGLEEGLEYIAEDELVEVTPESVRIRKRHLKETERRKLSRAGK
ncbi:MAG: translational GTPase TypA [Planctomycetota bacterium]